MKIRAKVREGKRMRQDIVYMKIGARVSERVQVREGETQGSAEKFKQVACSYVPHLPQQLTGFWPANYYAGGGRTPSWRGDAFYATATAHSAPECRAGVRVRAQRM